MRHAWSSTRLVAGSAAALLAWAAASAGPAGPRPDLRGETLARLLEEARTVQEADMLAWGRHRFRRTEVREKLGADGRVREAATLEAVVTPSDGGFLERLVRIDGRAPSPRDIEAHAADGRFARRYARMMRGEGDDDQGGYSLGYLLRMSSYRHAGMEEAGGRACHRLEFAPGVRGEASSLAERFAEVMGGTLWISEEGLHIVRAAARSVRPVPLALGLARVQHLDLKLESAPVAGGAHWLPRRLEVRTDSRVMGVPLRRRNLYEYSDFEQMEAARPDFP
ncbi:MAG TPA: hypothetical protein VJV23_11215 [Candidatus Polarisedimenticolia bacterium]|nr:hypothetical protein [Candidatus Polarisedimenticolia bacterium]